MPELMVLSCPVCGASLTPDSERCPYCGSYIIIKTDLPKLDRKSLNQSVIQDHINTFRQRIRTNDYDEEAHYGLGLAYYSLGLLDDAIEELSRAARLMPENPHIQAQLAIAHYDSYKSGDTAAETQMNSRIQRALLLDPDHLEANVLKMELLIDRSQYSTVIRALPDLLPDAQARVRGKVVRSLETTFEQRLSNRKWDGAAWCWMTLQPLDDAAAKQLAIQFLQVHQSLVPKKLMFVPKSNNRTGSLLGWRSKKTQTDSSQASANVRTSYSREELLWGIAQTDQTIEAANAILKEVKSRETIKKAK